MENQKTIENEDSKGRSVGKGIVVGVFGALSAAYLLNPTMGVFELIPDNIPVIGNLDEAAAAALLISCLAYFGVDIGNIFGKAKKDDKDSDIIDVEVE